MRAYIDIGASREFRLSEAVLVYRGGGEGAFASLHQVKQAQDGVPYLAPGELLTTAFVRALAQGLGARVAPEIFPDSVLARTHAGPIGVVVTAATARDVLRRNERRGAQAQRSRLSAPCARLQGRREGPVHAGVGHD